MARSRKSSRAVTGFQQKTRIEVERAPFKLLASVRNLDVAKLARARSTNIELGYFETDCCRQMVRAHVREGMVTGLVLEPCDEEMGTPASPELLRLFEIARKRISKTGKPFRGPMPLATFLSNVVALTVETITCVRICILGFCFVCCTTKIPGTPIVCGKKVIIVTI